MAAARHSQSTARTSRRGGVGWPLLLGAALSHFGFVLPCHNLSHTCQFCLSAASLAPSASGQSDGSTGTDSGSGSAVPPFVASFSGRYPVDWSLVPTVQPALSIPSDTDLGPCVCDLTWSSCDVNCHCDPDCSLTEQMRFSATLPEGPKSTQVLTCLDPKLVSINDRGALTVTLIDNMLCVAEDNNPSLGLFLSAPSSITDAQFSKARSDAAYLYQPVDPLAAAAAAAAAASGDANYMVDDIVVAARQDLTVPTPDINQVFYQTNGGQFVLPTAAADGTCSDSNFLRYLRSDTRSCLRAASNLEAACVAGGIFSGARYVDNIKVGKIRTANPTLTTQYVAANISAVYSIDADTGAVSFLSSQSYGSSSASSGGNSSSSGYALLGPFVYPEPVWNATACRCDNVLVRVEYVVTHEAGGQISSVPAPNIVAYVTSIAATDGTCGGAVSVTQTFSSQWQLSNFVTNPPSVPIRPKSGNPGYVVGRPLLSGVLTSQSTVLPDPDVVGQTVTQTLYAIAQDVGGMTIMPIAEDGRCSLSPTDPVQSISFGHDSKFTCYLSLTLSELQALCAAGSSPSGGVVPYFGNVSTSLGVWGNSDFVDINEWVSIKQTTSPPVGNWVPSTRTCAGLTTSINLEVATTDAGAFNNPQRRVLAAQIVYGTSTWQFTGEDANVPQLFPVFATASFIHVPHEGLEEYTPQAPPLLPKFPSDLLYPLYIESAATSAAPSAMIGAACALAALLLAATQR